MAKSSLHNPYTVVEKDGVLFYGGNQSWCQSPIMKKSGCGVIAGTDLLLYLSLHKERCKTDFFIECQKSNGILDYEEYMNYVNLMRKRYFPVVPLFGMPGWMLVCGVNRYLRHYRTGLKASWGVFPRNLWIRISAMLAHDIPVILAVGPNFPLIWRRQKLTFYHKTQGDGYTPSSQVSAHFVTVTGMDDTWLRISSWGREYFINKKEYLTYAGKYSTFLVSNICYIRSR